MSKLDLTLNPNWGCSDKEADDRTEPDSFEPTMQVNMKVTPDQNSPAYQLALAIDALRSRIEDYQDDLRLEWENDLGDLSEHYQWNAEDAAGLLEQAVELIDPLFNAYE